MFPIRRHIAALFILLATTLAAQQPRTLILLDPAHGGPDAGAHLPNNVLEKDVTLAFASRLRVTLTTAGLAVMTTRDADPTTLFTADQRAGIANHDHPTACLLLHATDNGSPGIHIITSALAATEPQRITPWDNAQSASIPQSLTLATALSLALTNAQLPVTITQATLHPLDNLTCPAVAIEIAPLTSLGADPTPVTDPTYQQHIAQAIAAALAHWHTGATP